MPGTVTVACKLPFGLQLRVFKMTEKSEPVMGGGVRPVQRAEQDGKTITVRGWNPRGAETPLPAARGSYALTPGVDADFFAEWMKQNADLDAVRNNLIFAMPKAADVEAKVREHKNEPSGLEPVNPKKLPKGIESARSVKEPEEA